MDIRFLGHACFELSEGDTRVLVDPFLSGNPKAAVEASELEPTHIFLTHGHADHYGDVIDIGKRTGAQVVAITELAGELGEQGLENVADPNIGGTFKFDGADPSTYILIEPGMSAEQIAAALGFTDPANGDVDGPAAP